MSANDERRADRLRALQAAVREQVPKITPPAKAAPPTWREKIAKAWNKVRGN